MNEAKNIVSNLASLNGALVFCDDSDVHGKPNPNFVADIRVLCAIKMESSSYGRLDLAQLLNKYKKQELHTSEVVNPTKTSEWYGVDYNIRLDVLMHAKQLVLDNVDKIYYRHVSKEQYKELRREAENRGAVNVNRNAGLKRVFLRTLIGELEHLQQPTALLVDQSNHIDEPRFDFSYQSNILEGRYPIIATSLHVQGIQLADFVAWTITRYVRKRHEWNSGITNEFDKIAAELLADSTGKIEHLLNSIERDA